MSEDTNNTKFSGHLCRLCGYSADESDFIDIFQDDEGYDTKIKKYLYLVVQQDEMSAQICWMCVQQLDNFHKFHEKIHEKQKKLLKEKYNFFSIKLNFSDAHEYQEFETIEVKESHSIIGEESEMELQMNENEENTYYIVEAKVEDEVEKDTSEVSEKPVAKRKRKNIVKISKTVSSDEEFNDLDQQATSDEDYDAGLVATKKRKRSTGKRKKKRESISDLDYDDDEGQSENDFPDPDSEIDDDDVNVFPEKIIENGLLMVKGKKLMSMICKFYDLNCQVCEKKFKILKDLLDHYTSNHEQQGYVTCCQTKFYRHPSIIMHMARHIQPSAFKCEICNYMVTRPRFLNTHLLTHLPENERPFACDVCPRKFCWAGALKTHQASHLPPEERRVYACHCGKVYESIGSLNNHKKSTHNPDKTTETHVCHICAKSFSTRSGLTEHLTTIHQPREQAQVQCPECSKWLMNARCLKSHMVLHSNVEFSCDECDYTTKKLSLLNRHKATKHSEEKPFACPMCQKSFKMKRALTIHIQSHTQEPKSYQCEFCDRVFASSTNFYSHRKKIHPKELAAKKKEKAREDKEKRIQAGVQYKDYIEVDFTNI